MRYAIIFARFLISFFTAISVLNEILPERYNLYKELLSIRAVFITQVTSYVLFLLHELYFTYKLQVTSYELSELRVNFQVHLTSYCLLHDITQNSMSLKDFHILLLLEKMIIELTFGSRLTARLWTEWKTWSKWKKVDNFNNKKIIIYYNHGKWYTREYDGTTKVS